MFGGSVLGYFELLYEIPSLQSDMENYIEAYNATGLIERKNNLEFIML